MTQIMNLLHLAPDIQEALLHLPAVERGHDPVTERDLRPLAALHSWAQQRSVWKRRCDLRPGFVSAMPQPHQAT
jgi:hypothetical protein